MSFGILYHFLLPVLAHRVLHSSGSVFDNARFIRILSAAKRYCCKYGKKGKSKSFHSFGEAHILIGLFTCGLLEAEVYADSGESAVNYRENPQDTYLVQHVAERSPHTLEPDENPSTPLLLGRIWPNR